MNNDTIFYIACNQGRDQGMTAEPLLTDVFTLYDDEQNALFRLTYTHNGDEGIDGMHVVRLGSLAAEALPGIYGGIHLGTVVYDRLTDMLVEHDAEFFEDIFVNGSGNYVYLPIQLSQEA